MKKLLIILLLCLCSIISYGQSDPAPSGGKFGAVSGYGTIVAGDTTKSIYIAGYGWIDLASLRHTVPYNNWTQNVNGTGHTESLSYLIIGGTSTANINLQTISGTPGVPINGINLYEKSGFSWIATDSLTRTFADHNTASRRYFFPDVNDTLANRQWVKSLVVTGGGGTGTVTSFGKTDNFGIISTVSNPTTTPNHAVGVDTTVIKSKAGSLTDYNILKAAIAAKGAGSVTSVSSATSDISVANASTTPAITLSTVNSKPLAYFDPTSSIQTQLNGKQGNLTVTTTGSGAANLSGNTLNIPTPVTTALANPTATIGLTAISGSAATAMRSDAAPAISQAITPNWTGLHTYSQNGIGETATDAVILQNTTPSTSGTYNATTNRYSNQQDAPALHLKNSGWSTSSSASKTVDFWVNSLGVQSANGGGMFQIIASLAGGTPVQGFSMDVLGNTYIGTTSYTNGTFGAGNLNVTGGPSYNLTMPNVGTNAIVATANDLYAGASAVVSRTILGGSNGGDMSGSNYAYANVLIRSTPVYGNGTPNKAAAALVVNPVIFNTAYPSTTLQYNYGVYINNPTTGTYNYPLYVNSGLSYFGGALSVNAAKTVISASTSGTAEFNESQVGTATKRVDVYLYEITGTATYSFPTAFINTPVVINTSGPSASVVTSLSTTGITITGSSTTGPVIIEGY